MFSIKKLGAIGRTYRHINRYHRILRVLFKYGFEDLVEMLHIDQYLESGLQMINRKPREQIEKLSRPERLRLAFEELGFLMKRAGSPPNCFTGLKKNPSPPLQSARCTGPHSRTGRMWLSRCSGRTSNS